MNSASLRPHGAPRASSCMVVPYSGILPSHFLFTAPCSLKVLRRGQLWLRSEISIAASYPYQCAATTTGLKGRGPRANLLKYIWRTATPSPHRCLINSGTNYSTNLLLTIARLRRALRSCRSHDSPVGSFVRPHRVLLCSRCSNPRSSRIFMTYGTGASLMNNNLTTTGLAETQQLMCILLPCVSAIRQINSVAASTWVNSKVTTVVVFGLDSYSASAILP